MKYPLEVEEQNFLPRRVLLNNFQQVWILGLLGVQEDVCDGAGLGEEVGEVELPQSVDGGVDAGPARSQDTPASHRRCLKCF